MIEYYYVSSYTWISAYSKIEYSFDDKNDCSYLFLITNFELITHHKLQYITFERIEAFSLDIKPIRLLLDSNILVRMLDSCYN